jgi:2-polyprenyl-3-methyl-5-hydroxy-6-metoxy-1,4-benzoquinol methylase
VISSRSNCPGFGREQVTVRDRIATEEVEDCLFCGVRGTSLYSRLTDRLFEAPGEWGFWHCSRCGLVWLNPRPLSTELGKVYGRYFTHVQERERYSLPWLRENVKRGLYSTVLGYESLATSWVWRQAGKALRWVPLARELATLGTMGLDGEHRGRMLDVGCGNGAFLSMMRDAGWDVIGLEPDPEAARVAHEQYALPVTTGSLTDAKFPARTFDVVTLSHVIEHVHEPVALFRECLRLLKPEGSILVETPNMASRGHREFGSSWAALDPPRHLFLYTASSLRTCCERAGLSVRSLRTSTRMAPWGWAASKTISQKGFFRRESDYTLKLRIEGLMFQMREERSRRTNEEAGEELILVGGPKESA